MANISRRKVLTWLGAGAAGSLLGGGVAGGVVGHWYRSQTGPAAPIEGLSVPPQTVETPSGLRIHHIQTGYVAVKQAHREHAGVDGMGFPAILTDSQWTEWMPISAWVIEHPEGVIMVDTGETSRVVESDFFNCDPGTNFIYHAILRLAVSREDEIDQQLRGLGIGARDVRWVVQTHMHSDHADGLSHFPHSEILISRIDYPDAMGALTCRYPDWLNPTLVTFQDAPFGAFSRSYPITQAGDVVIVPTPGHALGHQSVIVRDGDADYFFAGDTSFSEAQLFGERVAGIVADPAQTRASARTILAHARQHPTVYLPSHDAESRTRLVNRAVVAG